MKSSLIKTHATKSITPAEADLLARVGIALVLQQRTGWHELHVAVNGGIVTLRGKVSSFYNRQLVVAVAKRVAGVMRVNDEVIVDESLLPRRREVVELPQAIAPVDLETAHTNVALCQ